MKKAVAVLLLFIGCAKPYVFQNDYQLGKQLKVNVGGVMIGWEEKDKALLSLSEVQYGYRYELRYAGVDRGVLNVDYREFLITSKGALARDAFSSALKYDLATSNVITYKQFEMRVDSATGRAVHFVVLSDGAQRQK